MCMRLLFVRRCVTLSSNTYIFPIEVAVERSQLSANPTCRAMDKDKDGSVDYDEFLIWWKRQSKSERVALEAAQEELDAAAVAKALEETAGKEDKMVISNPLDELEMEEGENAGE